MKKINFESFEKFEDSFFKEKVLESILQIIDNVDYENVFAMVTRNSKNISVNRFSCNIINFDIVGDGKTIHQLECHKSNRNEYLSIKSN